MNFAEVFFGGGGILVLVLSIVQVSKIQINPWSWLARKIGRAINGEVIEKVDNLGKDLTALRTECEERKATTCRTRIMRFGDELLHDVRHSKEHFDQILLDVTYYETYCRDHPKFQNNIAVETICRIKSTYRERLDKRDFL